MRVKGYILERLAIGEGGEKSYQDSLVLPSLLYLARYYIHIYSSLKRFRCYNW